MFDLVSFGLEVNLYVFQPMLRLQSPFLCIWSRILTHQHHRVLGCRTSSTLIAQHQPSDTAPKLRDLLPSCVMYTSDRTEAITHLSNVLTLHTPTTTMKQPVVQPKLGFSRKLHLAISLQPFGPTMMVWDGGTRNCSQPRQAGLDTHK